MWTESRWGFLPAAAQVSFHRTCRTDVHDENCPHILASDFCIQRKHFCALRVKCFSYRELCVWHAADVRMNAARNY